MGSRVLVQVNISGVLEACFGVTKETENKVAHISNVPMCCSLTIYSRLIMLVNQYWVWLVVGWVTV